MIITQLEVESSKADQTYSPTMDDLIKAFYSIEVHLPSFWWVERVPSKSNPGDEPSRFEGRASAALWNARFLPGFKCQAKVADWLIKTASQRRLGCLSAFTFTFTAVKGLCLCRACNLSNYQLGKRSQGMIWKSGSQVSRCWAEQAYVAPWSHCVKSTDKGLVKQNAR